MAAGVARHVHETGVSPGGQSGSLIVAPEAEKVERTRRKTWSRARSEALCPTVSSEGATDDLDPGRPLRTRAGPRPRRDGPRPQGEGPPARAIGRGQGALGAVRPRSRLRRALPP